MANRAWVLKICVGINKEEMLYDYTCPSANKPRMLKALNVQLRLNHRTTHPMLRPHPHTNPDFLPRGLQGYHIHPGYFRNNHCRHRN